MQLANSLTVIIFRSLWKLIVHIFRLAGRYIDVVLAPLLAIALAYIVFPSDATGRYILGFAVFAAVAAALLFTPVGVKFQKSMADKRKTRALYLKLHDLIGEATNIEKPVFSFSHSTAGIVVHVRIPKGRHAGAFLGDLGAVLQAAFDAFAVHSRSVSGGTVEFVIQEKDPLAVPVPPERIRNTSHDLAQPVSVGVKETGTTAAVNLWAQTLLVGGSPGSGKSVFGWLVILAAAEDPSAMLVIVDLKPHGLETAPVHARADYVATDDKEAQQIFASVWEEVKSRYGVLKARNDGSEKVPTDERETFPPIVIIVDEAAELTRSGTDEGKAALELLTRIVAVGRAAGVFVMVMTQKPDATVLPTALRDLFAQRVCFRVGNRAQAETVLGVLGEGVKPWEVPAENPGAGVILGSDGLLSRFKAGYIGRPEILTRAAAAVKDRESFIKDLESRGTARPSLPVVELPPEPAEKPSGRRSRRSQKAEEE